MLERKLKYYTVVIRMTRMYAIRRSIQRRSVQAGIIIVALCLDAFSFCYFLVNVFSVSATVSYYDISL